ncbi:MGMT family protein [Altericista sp. CCNU0014]|uniref:MGMT family protein n=1 Tax=Altericista sp. CCNU0014 TaxID=3082949 RepID=UPI00384F0424
MPKPNETELERAKEKSPLYESIYAQVRQIPAGKVATYGQIAELVGLYGRARLVGYALFRVPLDSQVPWQRVINAKGTISQSPMRQGNDELQQILLEREGIIFDARGRVDLKRFQWHPDRSSLEETFSS